MNKIFNSNIFRLSSTNSGVVTPSRSVDGIEENQKKKKLELNESAFAKKKQKTKNLKWICARSTQYC
jgi:hypothetical protein